MGSLRYATWSTRGDCARVQQIVTNLVENAAKSPPCGTIDIRAEDIDLFVRLTIRDTGGRRRRTLVLLDGIRQRVRLQFGREVREDDDCWGKGWSWHMATH